MGKTKILLNETEVKYLRDDKLENSYKDRPDKIKRRIKEDRVSKLPERFERLFRDVRLLNDKGYLDRETWRDGWSQLIDTPVENQGALLDYTPPQRAISGIVSSTPSGPEDFGRRLGQTASHVTTFGEDNAEDVLQEVVWGFMKGVHEQFDEDTILESVEEVSQTLSRRAKKELDLREGIQSESQQTFEQRWEDSEIVRERIEQALSWNESGSDDWIIKEIERHLRYNSSTDLEALVTTEVEDSEPLRANIQEIHDIVEENQLVPKQRLVNALGTDLDRLKNKSGRGPEGVDTLLAISKNPGNSSRAISKILVEEDRNGAKWTGGVTELARDLAGEDKIGAGTSEHDIWTEHPVIQGTKEDWKTTPYGTALVQYYYATPASRRLRPLNGISDEVIIDAIEQLELSTEVPSADNGGEAITFEG